MHRTTLLATTFAALLAGSTAFAFAQQAPSAAPAPSSAAASTRGPATHAHAMDRGMQRGHFGHGGDRMRGGVISDLHGLARLYDQAGRGKEMAAVYNDVLARSQDPRVRNYVYQQLARLQARPANVDAAIATLRKGLDDSLASEAKMRASRDQMRSRMQQPRDGTGAPAASPSGGNG